MRFCNHKLLLFSMIGLTSGQEQVAKLDKMRSLIFVRTLRSMKMANFTAGDLVENDTELTYVIGADNDDRGSINVSTHS